MYISLYHLILIIQLARLLSYSRVPVPENFSGYCLLHISTTPSRRTHHPEERN